MLLHKLRHVEANHGALRAEQKFRERARNFSFTYARRSKEKERANGALRILQARARTTDRTRERRDGGALRDDAIVKLNFDAQQLVLLLFLERSDGDARPARDHFFDVGARDVRVMLRDEVVRLAQQR